MEPIVSGSALSDIREEPQIHATTFTAETKPVSSDERINERKLNLILDRLAVTCNELVKKATDKLKEIGLIDDKESEQKQQIILALVAGIASTLMIIILIILYCCLLKSGNNIATNTGDDLQHETAKKMEILIERINLLDNMFKDNDKQFLQHIQQLISLYSVLKLKVTSAKSFLSTIKVAMDNEMNKRVNATSSSSSELVEDKQQEKANGDDYKLAFLFEANNTSSMTVQATVDDDEVQIETKLLVEHRQNQQKQLQLLLANFELEINHIYEAIERSYTRKQQLNECLANSNDHNGENVESVVDSEDNKQQFEELLAKFQKDPINFNQLINWLQLYTEKSQSTNNNKQRHDNGQS